jgi:hypothetical protein
VATRAFQRLRGRPARPPRLPGRLLAGLLTFHFVALCWIFFRAPSFDVAWAVLAKIAEGSWYAPNLTPQILGALGAAALLHFLPRGWYARTRALFVAAPAPAQAAVLLVAAVVLSRLATTFVPFIYQQF